MKSDRIRFAILGYGNIGKRYAAIINRIDKAELVAIIDVGFAQIKAEGSVSHYENLDSFLAADIACDVIIVATPNGLHAEHATACLKAGKHVLVEKPVAFRQAEVAGLIEVANEMNRRIIPVWQIRFSPLIKTVQALLATGELGKVFWLQADCFWNRGEQYYKDHAWHGTFAMDGGPLYTQFSHVIDLISWLCSDAQVQDASFYKIRAELGTEFEDSGVVNFRLMNDAVALLSYTTSAPPNTSSNELTLITEKAKIQLSGKYFEELAFLQTHDKKIKKTIELVTESPIKDFARYCTEELIEHVVSNINDPSAGNDVQSLSVATAIIEQVYKRRPFPFYPVKVQ